MMSNAHDPPDLALPQALPQRLTGQIVGGYRLIEPLAHWPVGAVYLGARVAHEASWPHTAVVKVLGSTVASTTEERTGIEARDVREVAILQRLSHPHILHLLAFGVVWGMPYLVTPFLSGGTLATALCAGPLPLLETARYLREIASALDYAHGEGILHGDVKPRNVLLDAEGASYVSEFGLARLLSAEQDASQRNSSQRNSSERNSSERNSSERTGIVIGTPEYMAPEQAQGVVVGPAADLFSLSVLLYQLVTGALPFSASSPSETLLRVLRDTPTSPHLLRPDLPPAAEAALLKGLAKRPEDRFASARDLAHAFGRGWAGSRDGA